MTHNPVQSCQCADCGSNFTVYDTEVEFYKSFEVPIPKYCFYCRLQRRLTIYNRRNLYRRKCDHSGKEIASMFSPDKQYTVYEKDIWYSDAWDPFEYGRDYDFSKTFNEQFDELQKVIPHQSMAVMGHSINSDFCNDQEQMKNSYLACDAEYCENTYYSETLAKITDASDLFICTDCELCYECVECERCYSVCYSQYAKGCSDSWFLRDCVGCSNCFGCCNLNQKEYYVFNEPYGKDRYQQFIAEFDSGSYSAIQKMRERVEQFFATQPLRSQHGLQNTNIVGDYLHNSKNAFYSFGSRGVEDSMYITECHIPKTNNCIDIHNWGAGLEFSYNCTVCGLSSQRIMTSCFVGSGCSNVAYSYFCTSNCHDLFGCSGLRNKRNCILNKAYSKEEYDQLRKKIVGHMLETGEWGEFFSPGISPFGYNETFAPDHFPISKEEVLAKGWKWSDYQMPVSGVSTLPAVELPDNIQDVDDSIVKNVVECSVSGKPFKIITPELKFYRKMKLPLPRVHPANRQLARATFRNPFRLYKTNCSLCKGELITTFAGGLTNLSCENCYHSKVVQ